MYAAGGGDGYLTMAETALGAVQSAGLLDRFADVFSISNKKNREIAFALHLENGEYTSGSYFSYFIWGSTQIKAEYRNAPDGVPSVRTSGSSTRTTSSGSSSGARSWATSGPM